MKRLNTNLLLSVLYIVYMFDYKKQKDIYYSKSDKEAALLSLFLLYSVHRCNT